MKTKFILLFAAVFCLQNATAQEYIDYQGTRYPTHSPVTDENPTVKIRPFDQKKFDAQNGIIDVVINGQTVKFDCKTVCQEDLTKETLEVPYEVNDTATYGKTVEQRINYIKEQITLLSEIKELIANFKSLDGREPLGNAQKIYLATLIDHRKDCDIKVLQAAQKAKEKNKYDKKLEPLNAILLPQIEKESSYLNNLLKAQDDWDKILQAALSSSSVSRPDNYPKGEEWAHYVADIKKKSAIANIPNPFLLDEIEVPNPIYGKVEIGEDKEDEYLLYSQNDYNYTMDIPMCFKKDFDLFFKNGGGTYDILYGRDEYEDALLTIATQKHSGYLYLDGKSMYENDMTYGVYRDLTNYESETNKKTISKDAFSNGYLIICNMTCSGKPCTSKFYALNLRNNVQLRIYIRYPQSMNNEFESYIQHMLDSIEAF